MKINWNSQELEFMPIDLIFKSSNLENIFADKNNNSLGETIEHKRYLKFKERVQNSYSDFLEWELGRFLHRLKSLDDRFYMNFLNKNGDKVYSNFYIDDKNYLNSKGLYAYFVGDEVKYIGRCRDSFKKRINQGYGKIHPKNCYLDGQSTNCHLNNLVTLNKDQVKFCVYPMENVDEIVLLEEALIRELKPQWNIALNRL
ncbi:hypothetical protein CR194_05310 [Salipaludibacillus keqinensis]|uniref:GIY-YIG domain-containing protein n=1 Tax=Salipaludibacillus keqinensis TaxID=2045207 RepID=A0A323TJJ5_9BACI|nr:hypothetical protein [Salipaludibacillus keqinensis]PYZ94939.1 hypothetical protein CR194_05310 [Salipaludibacillus keqinensis]